MASNTGTGARGAPASPQSQIDLLPAQGPQIWIPTSSVETNLVSNDSTAASGSKKTTYVAYHVHVRTPTGERTILRRMHEFHEFHKIWTALYEGLKEQFELPSTYAIIKTASVLDKRRQGLETYLQGLNEVKAMRPLIAQFLGMEESEMYGESRITRAPNAEALAKMGQSGVTNTALSLEEVQKLNSRRGRGLSNPDIIQGLEVEGKNPLPAMYAIQDRAHTYIVPGQSIVSATDVADESKVVISQSASKGNTHAANEQARRDKEEFLRQNAGVIASLMPGRQINVMFNKGKVSETAQRSLGRVQVSIWYREGTGGQRRPLPPAHLEPGQHWVDNGGGTIMIDIHRGMDLASTDGITNPYVKMYLVPDPKKTSKRKTKPKSKTVNPTWEESFEYPDLYPSELPFKHLSIAIWDDRFGSKNACIGEVILSDLSYLPRSAADRLTQWFDLKPWSGLTTVASSASSHISGSTSSRSSPPSSPLSGVSGPTPEAYAMAANAGAAANSVPQLTTAPPVMPTALPPRLIKSGGVVTPKAVPIDDKKDESLLKGIKNSVLSNFTGGSGVLVPTQPLPQTPSEPKKSEATSTASRSTETNIASPASASLGSSTPNNSAATVGASESKRDDMAKVTSSPVVRIVAIPETPVQKSETTSESKPEPSTATAVSPAQTTSIAVAPAAATAEALYDYVPSEAERAASTVLPLRRGEIVTLLDKSGEEWWYGQTTNGSVGYFPKAYVKLV